MKATKRSRCAKCGADIYSGQEIIQGTSSRHNDRRRVYWHARCPHDAYQQERAEAIREVVEGPKKRRD